MEQIVGTTLAELVGDYNFKKFVDEHRRNPLYKILGYAAYIVCLECFQNAIEEKGLAWSNAMWDSYSNLVSGTMAFVFLGEKASPEELVGYVLITIGIMLVGQRGSLP